MGTIENLNRHLFLVLNAGQGTLSWAVDGAVLIGNDLIDLIPLLLIGLWLWGGRWRRALALRAFLAAMLGLGLNQVLGALWFHPRPFMLGLGHTWLAHAPDSSFPSDHVTVFAAVGLVLLLGGARRTGTAVLACGLGVAWARVFLGVHFPLDMAGALGTAGIACLVLAPAWRRAGDGLLRLLERPYRVVLGRPIERGWVRR